MTPGDSLSRRGFLALAGAAAPLASAASKGKSIPVGLELYSVRDELKKDPQGTVRAVAKMGYQDVEFFSPYASWTVEQAKDMRKLLDELNIRCLSTHNGPPQFTPENLPRTIELNHALGTRYVVMASAGRIATLDGWKQVADTLNRADDTLKGAGLHAGYHNHQLEFRPLEGKRPIEILADNTSKDIMLQLDVGTCIEAGSDPVEWINTHPGRIKSMHVKEWSPDPAVGYKALFGEGKAPWKQIFQAAEKTGGVEFYLIEQEGSRYPELETAQKCLEAFRKVRHS